MKFMHKGDHGKKIEANERVEAGSVSREAPTIPHPRAAPSLSNINSRDAQMEKRATKRAGTKNGGMGGGGGGRGVCVGVRVYRGGVHVCREGDGCACVKG